MKLYYWNTVPNLGDVMNQLLFPEAEWAPPHSANWVGIGSLLELFDGWDGTIFGTGRAGPTAPSTDLSRARVLALRGRLSLALVNGAKVSTFGDPGLLADRLVRPRYRDPYVAVVPHHSDQERMQNLYPGARFVDVTGDPLDAIRLIAEADRIVSSSLHGIVIADAFDKPRMWEWFDGVQAKGFKFHDYGSVVGEFEPGEWKQPGVEHIKRELGEVLSGS